ncbi:hypothetical protein [Vibrio ouci]|uniref:Uncharacterized protein n=1 Tax=Vibrio ouci TaxID=2499078 RepID=A0A4Y8W7N6_9VIBR|nr:hypothetical protein [Vibrio ouci]TFH88919.1 hypothetical protein ELS82_25220 [Vibrio ouci]
MAQLSTVLGEFDTQNTPAYCWLEAAIRQSQLNRFTECCAQRSDVSVLCLVKVHGQNAYNLCFTKDVDQCICCLRSLCQKPVELVAYGNARLNPGSLLQILSDPKLQKNRWFPLTDRQRDDVVNALKSQSLLADAYGGTMIRP